MLLDLDWNAKLDWQSKSKILFRFWIVNHNPIHQTGLQSGLSNPIQQYPGGNLGVGVGKVFKYDINVTVGPSYDEYAEKFKGLWFLSYV